MVWIAMILMLIGIAESSVASVIPLPFRPSTVGYTEEVWIYLINPVNTSFSVFYEEGRSEVQVATTGVSLWVNISNTNIKLTPFVEYLPKPKRWLHLAVSFSAVGTEISCYLYTNGRMIKCQSTLDPATILLSAEYRALFSSSDSAFSLYNLLYYRNYRIWDGMLTQPQLASVMTKSKSITVDSRNVIGFLSFSAGERLQQDKNTTAGKWIVLDESEINPLSAEFLQLSQEFDSDVMTDGQAIDFLSEQDTLLINMEEGKSGPALFFSNETLSQSDSFTVELWLAFEGTSSKNITIVGMAGKNWYEGFGIGGVMNSTAVTLGCMLDNTTIYCTSSTCDCSTNPNLCLGFTTKTRTWKHFVCARTGNNQAQVMLDSTAIEVTVSPVFQAPMKTLFSSNVLFLGPQSTDEEKIAGFNGYIKELRMWSRYLNKYEVLEMMYKRLSPNDHSALVGYWPLSGGRGGEFFDNSAHAIADVSINSPNSTARGLYGTGSFSWTQVGELWNLPLCSKSQIFDVKNSVCLNPNPHIAFYSNNVPFQINSGTDKGTLNGWDYSFSAWVYHANFSSEATIFEISNATSVILTYTNTPSFTMTARYQKVIDLKVVSWTLLANQFPTLGKWIHYGFATSSSSSLFLINSVSSVQSVALSLTTLPTKIAFVFGNKLQGYMREIKSWTRTLTLEELIEQKYKEASKTDSSLLAYWKLCEGINSYALDFSSTPSHVLISSLTTDDSQWLYVDEKLKANLEYQETRLGSTSSLFTGTFSNTRLPRSKNSLLLHSGTLDSTTERTLEFWIKPIVAGVSNLTYIDMRDSSGSPLWSISENTNYSNVTSLLFNVTSPSSQLELLSVVNSYWQYVGIHFGGKKQVFKNGTFVNFFTITEFSGTVKLYLNLNASSFREVKMFSRIRSESEMKVFEHTQSDASKEDLVFYYPLTSDFYLLNAVNPENKMSNLLRTIRWEGSPDAGFHMCPPGYYNYVDSGLITKTVDGPTCHQYTYLTTSVISAELSLELLTASPSYYSITGWIFYSTVQSSKDFLILNSDNNNPITLELYSETMKVLSGTTPVITHGIQLNRWVHFAYCFSSSGSNFYLFSALMANYGSSHNFPSTHPKIKLDIEGAYLFNLHIISSTSEIKSFFKYMEMAAYPTNNTSPELMALIPGHSLDSSNLLYVFTHIDPAHQITGVPVSEPYSKPLDSIQHPESASKFTIGSTAENLYIPLNSNMAFSNQMTIELWVKIGTIASLGYYKLEVPSGSVSRQSMIRVANDLFYYFKETATAYSAVTNKWTHLALVMGTNDDMYLDQKLIATITHSSPSVNPTWVCSLSLYQITITLKMLRVWKAALSLAELKQLSYVRLPVGSYNLYTIATFEPFSPVINSFPVYQYGNSFIDSVVKSSYLTSVSAGSNPLQCLNNEYFAGTKCIKTNVLYIKKDTTPGLVIPIRSQLAENLEWTVETWVYVVEDSTYTANAIAALQGDNVKLGVRSSGTNLELDWVYSKIGDTATLTGFFSSNKWNYVAITSRIELPYYMGEAILNCENKVSVSILYPSTTKEFTKLVLGMDLLDQSLMGRLALKEIRLWKIASTLETLKRRMRRRISHPESESLLLNYYRIDSDEKEYLEDSGFEGQFTRERLWSTPHSYQYPAGSSDVSTIVPPKVITPTNLGIPPLILCDENSFYSGTRCQRDSSEGEYGYELSKGPFILPLQNYNIDIEWTFKFWMQIQKISGVDSSIFKQICYPSLAGELRLKKSGVSQKLMFYLEQMAESITFSVTPRKWANYAFMNSMKTGTISLYIDGVKDSTEISGYSDYFYKCLIQVGEDSSMNIIYGKLRGIKFYNGTRTAFELSDHKSPIFQKESLLEFYLPLDEGFGLTVTERRSGTVIALPTSVTYRGVWISQGDLKICREPFSFNKDAHVCILPRARLLDTDSNSNITVPYSTPIVEAELFEFWIRIYTPAVTTSVTLIKQDSHFAFRVGSSKFVFQIFDSATISINSGLISDLNKWSFVAGLLGQNNIKSFLQIDDSSAVEGNSAGNITEFYNNSIIMFANITSSTNKFVAGFREFRIFGHYRSPAEIIERRFDTITTQSYGLEFYLKLDESSGAQVLEHVSGKTYYVSADFWDLYEDPQAINNGAYAAQLKSGMSLAVQDNLGHTIPLSENSCLESDFTFMMWMKFSKNGKLTLNVNGTSTLQVIIDFSSSQIITSTFNTTQLRSRGNPISSGIWQSYAYTKNPSTRIGYVNGKQFSNDEATPSSTLEGGGHSLYMLLGQTGMQVSVKELRILGVALSASEIRVVSFTKINLWEYSNYNFYSIGFQNFPSYNIEDWGIDHSLLYKGLSFASRRQAISGIPWVSDDLPILCGSNEIYDSTSLSCISAQRSLMFIRGRTHSIELESQTLEQNFTIEFWVNVYSNQLSTQKILSGDYFIVSFESNFRFRLSLFNDTTIGHKFYNSTSSNQFSLNTWTHIAIGNSEATGKSILIINGVLEGSNSFVVLSGAFSTYKISDDTAGFTGSVKHLVFWREYRSLGLLRNEMRKFQWYNHYKNFNLYGHFPLTEGSGFALYDYYASDPNDITTYQLTKTGYISPFWVEDKLFPILCKFPMFFDQELQKCRVFKKALSVGLTTITLPVQYKAGFREWSFKAWVKFNDLTTVGQTIINVPQLFRLKITGVNVAKAYITDDTNTEKFVNAFTSLSINTWYVFSAGFCYSNRTLISEMRPVMDTAENSHPAGLSAESTYYGEIGIQLYNANFMHISMWKKYSPLTGILNVTTAEMNDAIFLPGQHSDLIAYFPLEESAGTVLHDISIYGTAVNMSSSPIVWKYDSTEAGKILFSKYYQTTVNSIIPTTKSCCTNCYYCGTTNYCKACTRGTYLKNGYCISTNAAANYVKDLLEREFKPTPLTGYCTSYFSKTCTDSAGLVCQQPDTVSYCIRNAMYYDTRCYASCPYGSYNSTSNLCETCPNNCLTCNSSGCLNCSSGYLLQNGICTTTNCGNGIVETPETCDDGNQIDGDGCSKYCLIESDFTCIMLPSQGPSVCTPICGDGKFYGLSGEECDDGNTISGDGCDSECKLEANWWCEKGSPTTKSVCHCSPLHLTSYDYYSNSYMTLYFRFSLELSSLISASNSIILCQLIFGTQVSKFGSNYSCLISGDLLILNLGNGTTLGGGEELKVTSGVLGTQNCIESFAETLAVPIIPSQTVSGSIVVSGIYHYCIENTIWITNIQGGLSRPFNKMEITAKIISGGSTDDINISNQEAMNYILSKYIQKNASAYYIKIPANTMLSSALYTLTMTLTNFQNISYSTAANFSSTGLMVITIALEGLNGPSSLTISNSSKVSIRAVPVVYQCGVAYPNLTDITVAFSQVGGNHWLDMANITSSSVSSRFLIIPSGVLLSGHTYNFMVYAKSGSVSDTKNFSISVIDPDLVAVAEPSIQSIPKNKILNLYGYNSYDPINSPISMVYKWRCYNSSYNYSLCQYPNGTLVGTHKITNLNFPANYFVSGSKMVFVLSVTKDNRSANSNATVYIMDDSSPEVQLAGPTSKVQLQDTIHIRLELPSLPVNSCNFSWEVEGCENHQCIVGDTDNNYVRIKVNKIFPLSNNQFNVTGIVSYSTKNSSATIMVQVEETPTKGTLSVSPTVGEGWSTNFSIIAKDFSLASGNKVKYQFFLVEDSKYMAISSLSEENSILTMLPTGNISDSYILNISVRAYNERGGYTELSTTIKSLQLLSSKSVLAVYSLIKENLDYADPINILRQAAVGSLILSEKPKKLQSTAFDPCNSKGVYTESGECVCDEGYKKRIDCSLSDEQFKNESNLAVQILQDLRSYSSRLTVNQPQLIFDAVGSVIEKSDLINDTTRGVARNLLEQCLNESSEFNDLTQAKLMKYLDLSASTSPSSQTTQEYAQTSRILSKIIQYSWNTSNQSLGAASDLYDMNNFAVQYAILRGSMNKSVVMDSVTFPQSALFLNNTDNYVSLTVTKWKIAQYSWIPTSTSIKSKLIAIGVHDLNGNVKEVSTVSSPINMSFSLNIGSLSGQVLSAMRCLYYNDSLKYFSVKGMKSLGLNITSGTGYCQTNHLSDFAMGLPQSESNELPDPEKETFTIFGVTITINGKVYKSPFFWFTIVLTILIGLLFVYGQFKENSQSELSSLMSSPEFQSQKELFQGNLEKTEVHLQSQGNNIFANESALGSGSNRSGGIEGESQISGGSGGEGSGEEGSAKEGSPKEGSAEKGSVKESSEKPDSERSNPENIDQVEDFKGESKKDPSESSGNPDLQPEIKLDPDDNFDQAAIPEPHVPRRKKKKRVYRRTRRIRKKNEVPQIPIEKLDISPLPPPTATPEITKPSSILELLLKAHEYSGLFLYTSPHLTIFKRVALLYTKLTCMILFCSLFFVKDDSFSSFLWVCFGLTGALGGNALEFGIRMMIKKRENDNTAEAKTEEDEKARKRSILIEYIINLIGLGSMAALSICSMVVANVIAAQKTNECTFEMFYTIFIGFVFDVFLIQSIYAVIMFICMRMKSNNIQAIGAKL